MSDILLDDTQMTALCDNFKVQGHDLLLDAPARRTPNGPVNRRALVHDENDGLTLNYSRDYPGGVTIDTSKLVLTGDLQVTMADRVGPDGRVSYPGGPTSLADMINYLRDQVDALQAQVAQLTPRP
jgi:hypothetical protein